MFSIPLPPPLPPHPLRPCHDLDSSLDACEKPDEPYFNVLTRYMAVRCMPRAEYVCAGESEALGESYAHFGLATPLYAHFTSPIRRYADQIVHRMLAASIGWEEAPPSLYDEAAITHTAKVLNERHRASKDAERDSVALFSLLFFREGRQGEGQAADGKVKVTDGKVEDGKVEVGYATTITSGGLSVLVPRYGIEGWVHPYASSGEAPFRLTEDGALCAGEHGKIRPLDHVSVRIAVDTQRLHPKLTMVLVDPESGRPLCDVILKNQKQSRQQRAAEAKRERAETQAAKRAANTSARLRGG